MPKIISTGGTLPPHILPSALRPDIYLLLVMYHNAFLIHN